MARRHLGKAAVIEVEDVDGDVGTAGEWITIDLDWNITNATWTYPSQAEADTGYNEAAQRRATNTFDETLTFTVNALRENASLLGHRLGWATNVRISPYAKITGAPTHTFPCIVTSEKTANGRRAAWACSFMLNGEPSDAEN